MPPRLLSSSRRTAQPSPLLRRAVSAGLRLSSSPQRRRACAASGGGSDAAGRDLRGSLEHGRRSSGAGRGHLGRNAACRGGGDLDDDRFLEQYSKMRLAELRDATKAARFGSIQPITGSYFVREVSQAPSDVWVVVFLFKDGIPECGLLQTCLEELATTYPATKFIRIISTDCIPNYPDRNVPTVSL